MRASRHDAESPGSRSSRRADSETAARSRPRAVMALERPLGGRRGAQAHACFSCERAAAPAARRAFPAPLTRCDIRTRLRPAVHRDPRWWIAEAACVAVTARRARPVKLQQGSILPDPAGGRPRRAARRESTTARVARAVRPLARRDAPPSAAAGGGPAPGGPRVCRRRRVAIAARRERALAARRATRRSSTLAARRATRRSSSPVACGGPGGPPARRAASVCHRRRVASAAR